MTPGTIREQIRAGTPAALATGIVLGSAAGLALNGLHHSNLILPTADSRMTMVLLLATLGALLAAAALLPLQLVAGFCGRAAGRRLYVSIAAAGALFAFGALWMRFRIFHDPSSFASVAAHTVLATALLGAVALMHRGTATRNTSHGPSLPVLSCAVVALAAAAWLSYRHLTGYAQLHGTPAPRAHRQPSGAAAPTNAPNIVLISIDTLRADHVGRYGYSRPTTPNLDRLADSSVVFRNAFSAAPWTLPAHASLLTGLYPSSHGARFSSQHAPVLDKLDDSTITAAEILSQAGYRTAAFTSVFWLSDAWGTLQGFQDTRSETAIPANRIVDHALEWLDNRNKEPGVPPGPDSEQPFFLFLHLFDVHEFTSPPEFDTRYQETDYNGPLKTGPLLTSRNAYQDLTESDIRYLVAKYDGALNYVDQQLGRLLQRLPTDKTIIVVTSDHGEEFLDHGGTGHGFTLYREALHVPMILKLPNTPPAEVQIPISLVDVLPTILDCAAQPVPPRLEGISLRPLLQASTIPAQRLLFAEDTYFMNSAAVMDGDYKFIDNRIPPAELLNPRLLLVNLRSFFKFSPMELYNAKDDPAEIRNLAAADAKRAGTMRDQLAAHVKIQNVGEQDRLEEETLEKMRSVGYVQ